MSKIDSQSKKIVQCIELGNEMRWYIHASVVAIYRTECASFRFLYESGFGVVIFFSQSSNMEKSDVDGGHL